MSFRREAHVARGGPDGGDGGKGGDVWLVANHNVASLLAFKDHPHRAGRNGMHGAGKGRHGADGADLEVPVPIGTVVRLQDGEVLADLSAEGDRFLAAAGGRGGRGNARFLTNQRRAPKFAEQGEHGEERWLVLELKLMADVALVGFPNAGKSTLISRISAAKPKIADYPFTTLEPNLGVVRFDEHEFVVADIPGLIEGASEGRGLGHRFLRHIERARVLCVLIDLAPADGRSAAEQESVLLQELSSYEPSLLTRPRVVVGSKSDVAMLSDFDGLRVSSATGEGLPVLLGRVASLVSEARASEAIAPGTSAVVLRPASEGFRVVRSDDGAFVVTGRAAERAVALNDVTTSDAIAYIHERLTKLGVMRALARAGAGPGDVVHIGPMSFAYEPDQGVRR